MAERPYTLLSACMSIDGYLDAGTGQRLVLSNAADLDRVDAVRASCDAILVGAATVRADNPRLLVRDQSRQAARVDRGLPPSPTRVTVTREGDLDPAAALFTVGPGERIVYCATGSVAATRARLEGLATVVDAGEQGDLATVLEDLCRRGVRRLMVEGGGSMHTQLLAAGLADELQLVVAPFFVGDSRAPRFVGDAHFPWNPGRRATVADVYRLEDVVMLRYALSSRFEMD